MIRPPMASIVHIDFEIADAMGWAMAKRLGHVKADGPCPEYLDTQRDPPTRYRTRACARCGHGYVNTSQADGEMAVAFGIGMDPQFSCSASAVKRSVRGQEIIDVGNGCVDYVTPLPPVGFWLAIGL